MPILGCISFILTPVYQQGSVQKFWKVARQLILIWAFRKSTREVDLIKSIFLGWFSQTNCVFIIFISEGLIPEFIVYDDAAHLRIFASLEQIKVKGEKYFSQCKKYIYLNKKNYSHNNIWKIPNVLFCHII